MRICRTRIRLMLFGLFAISLISAGSPGSCYLVWRDEWPPKDNINASWDPNVIREGDAFYWDFQINSDSVYEDITITSTGGLQPTGQLHNWISSYGFYYCRLDFGVLQLGQYTVGVSIDDVPTPPWDDDGPITGTFDLYVKPADVFLQEYDPCRIRCASCKADVPKPRLESYGALSVDPIEDFIGPVDRTGMPIVLCEAVKEVDTFDEEGAGGNDLTVLYRGRNGKVWKMTVTMPYDTSEYPLKNGWILDGYGTIIRTQASKDGAIVYFIKELDGGCSVVSFEHPPHPNTWTQQAKPRSTTLPGDGYEGWPSRIQRDSLDRITGVDVGDKHWGVEYSTAQARINYPDQTYAIMSYYTTTGNGAYAGKPSSVEFFSSIDESVSLTSYTYDSQGRLATTQKGDREVGYAYDDDDHAITVSELSASPVVRTVYHYGWDGQSESGQPASDETWVIGKLTGNNSNGYETGDQRLNYKFNIATDGRRTDISQVTDPGGNITYYGYDSRRISSVVDPLSLQTTYSYNSISAITSVGRYRGGSLGGVTIDYYPDANGNETSCPRTIKDLRGNYTHFVRGDMLNVPWRVDEVKMSHLDEYGDPPASEPDWDAVENGNPVYPPIQKFEYYGSFEDITASATLTWDHEYSSPSMTPDNLKDGYVGSSHEDAGNWDYTEVVQGSNPYSNAYTYANVSNWHWSVEKHLSSINLYLDPNLSGYSVPQAVKVYAKDETGDYSILVYATKSNTSETWRSETWNGQSVGALHITTSISTSDLRITYGRSDGLCHLGEVQILAAAAPSTDGRSGQIKKVIIPSVTDDNVTDKDAWVEFKYGDNGNIREVPTQLSYRYFNETTQEYETKSCSATYDAMDRPLTSTDANGRLIQLAYDALGRMEKLTYATGVEAVNTFSCCGMLNTADPEGRTLNIEHDLASRANKAWVSDITGQSATAPLMENIYDCFGNVEKVRTYTASGSSYRESTYGYDANKRPTSLTYPGGIIGQERVDYDEVGNPLWTKDGNGQYTLYHYDDLHQLEAIGYSTTEPTTRYDGETPAPAVTLSYYTNTGLVHEVTKGNDTIAYAYDERGRVTSYTPSGHSAVTYTYNNLNQVTSVTSGSYNVQYHYRANGLLRDVTTNSGSVVLASYKYDQAGLLLEVNYGNGVKAGIGYASGDPRYPLESISYTKDSNSLASFSYTARDKTLNPRSISDSIINASVTYPAYDPMGQLTGATYPDPVPDQPAGGTHGYDWVGNRTNPPSGSNAMQYNAVDQLVLWPGMYAYSYDNAGNLETVRARNAQGPEVASYTYTSDGLLDEATYGSSTLTNAWDAMGNRVGLTVNSTSYSFTYNPIAGVPAAIEEVKSGSPGKTYYYYRDPNGVLIARCDPTDSNSWQYYHYDELGSTRLLTDKDGVVTDTYTYDPYGSVIAHNGSTNDNPYQFVGALGYYTHCQAPEFMLVQLGFRFYDPETGRFTQQDPIGDGINWYAYAAGNPLGFVDPWGLAWYDGWLNGDWGSRIPILGGLAAQAGTDWGNAESGRGSWGQAYRSAGKAAGATVVAGVGLYFGAAKIAGLGVAAWQASTGSAYILGQWANGALIGAAGAMGARYLSILPRFPTAYSWAANNLYMAIIYARNVPIYFGSDPEALYPVVSGFYRELQVLAGKGFPWTPCP
ncbi:MAG: hypothetical protein M1133_09270 [Armatimonadetes bacterium]|nr:hypothetical protein [Armatimonadota bacterium]